MGRRRTSGDKERPKLWETPAKPKFAPKPILDEIRADDEITGNPLLDEQQPGGEYEEYTLEPNLAHVDEFAVPLNFNPDEELLALLRSSAHARDKRNSVRSKSVVQACLATCCRGAVATYDTPFDVLVLLAGLQAARDFGRDPSRRHDDREHPANARCVSRGRRRRLRGAG